MVRPAPQELPNGASTRGRRSKPLPIALDRCTPRPVGLGDWRRDGPRRQQRARHDNQSLTKHGSAVVHSPACLLVVPAHDRSVPEREYKEQAVEREEAEHRRCPHALYGVLDASKQEAAQPVEGAEHYLLNTTGRMFCDHQCLSVKSIFFKSAPAPSRRPGRRLRRRWTTAAAALSTSSVR